jgi:hypothetical protein
MKPEWEIILYVVEKFLLSVCGVKGGGGRNCSHIDYLNFNLDLGVDRP